jgi:nucleoside phosphorylase
VSTVRAPYDLGLIIPTQEEFEYVRESVRFDPIRQEDAGFWYEFRVPGGRLGVAHVLFDVGLTATTAAAVRLLEKFDPEVLAVVGIGGGLSTELRLGDVVVGSVIHEYLKAARVASDANGPATFEPAGDGWPLAERLRKFTNNFRYFAAECYESWLRFAGIRGVEEELPFATTLGTRRVPAYFVLPIASGDVVVADPAFKNWLLSHDRKRALIEMEGAGAARAVQDYDRDVALLVLRGISDFADERKAALDAVVSGATIGAWRRYAAQNAIELLFAFLASRNFPWRAPGRPATDRPGVTAPAAVAANGPAQRSRRAWDYFMQAAQLVEGTAAGFELLQAWRSTHPAADGGHHGSDGVGDGGHGHGHGHEGPGHGHDIASESGEHDPVHVDVGHDVPVDPDVPSDVHPHLTDPHHH